MARSKKEWLARVLILLAGLTIAHLGVTLFLLSQLGSDPFNVLIQGLSRRIPALTHGTVHMAVCFLIILALLLIDRRYVRIGTLICMFFGGPIIDVFSLLFQPLFLACPMLWFRLLTVAAGCVILAFGMTLVIRSDAGTGPNDLVALVISDKTHAKFGLVRMVVDFSFVGVGYLLGGLVGIGTVVCAFLVGPVAGFFLPRSQRIVDHALRRVNA